MLPIGYKVVNNDGESFQVSGSPSCGIQNHILGLKRFQGQKEPLYKYSVGGVLKFSYSKCQMFTW